MDTLGPEILFYIEGGCPLFQRLKNIYIQDDRKVTLRASQFYLEVFSLFGVSFFGGSSVVVVYSQVNPKS